MKITLKFVLAILAFTLSGASWLFWHEKPLPLKDHEPDNWNRSTKGIAVVFALMSIAVWWMVFAA